MKARFKLDKTHKKRLLTRSVGDYVFLMSKKKKKTCPSCRYRSNTYAACAHVSVWVFPRGSDSRWIGDCALLWAVNECALWHVNPSRVYSWPKPGVLRINWYRQIHPDQDQVVSKDFFFTVKIFFISTFFFWFFWWDTVKRFRFAYTLQTGPILVCFTFM